MSSIALLFGVSSFDMNANSERVDSIDFAKNNVSSLRTLFSNEKVLGAKVVAPENPTRKQILVELVKVRDAPERYDTAFLYVCTHGKPVKGKLHLYGSDTTIGHEDQTSISFAEIRDLFLRIKSTNFVIILDACYSGLALTQAPSDFIQQIADETVSEIDVVSQSMVGPVRKDDLQPKQGGFTFCSSPPRDLSDKFSFEGEHTAFSGALIRSIRTGNQNASVERLTLNEIALKTQTILKTRHPEPYYAQLNAFGDVPILGNLFHDNHQTTLDSLGAQILALQSRMESIAERISSDSRNQQSLSLERKSFWSKVLQPSERPFLDILGMANKAKSEAECYDLAFETEACVTDQPDPTGLAFLAVMLIVAVPIIEGLVRSTYDWNERYFVETNSSWLELKSITYGFPLSILFLVALSFLLATAVLSVPSWSLYERWSTVKGGAFKKEISGLRHKSIRLLKHRRWSVAGLYPTVRGAVGVALLGISLAAALISGWSFARASAPSLNSRDLILIAPPSSWINDFERRVGLIKYSGWKSFEVRSEPGLGTPSHGIEIRIYYDVVSSEDQAVWLARQLSDWIWPVRLVPRIQTDTSSQVLVIFPGSGDIDE